MLGPSDYVSQYRSANPGTDLSDSDILSNLAAEAQSRGIINDHPALADWQRSQNEDNRGFFGELGSGWKRGVNNFEGQLYDTASLAGKATGIDALKDWGREHADAKQEDASSDEQATVNSYKDIKSFKDLAFYVAGQLGSQAPMLLGTTAATVAAGALAPEELVAGGVVGAGGLAARGLSALGLTAARNAAGGLVADGAADAVAGTAGVAVKKLAQFLAANAVGFSQMENYGALEKQGGDNVVPIAIANGLIGSALQSIVPLRFANHALSSEIAQGAEQIIKASPSWIISPALDSAWQYAQSAAKGAAKEGSIAMLTGIAQEATSLASEAVSNRDNPKWKLSPEEAAHRIIESGIGGFLVGGGLGAVSGIHEQMKAASADQTAAPSTEQPIAAPEVQQEAPAPLAVPPASFPQEERVPIPQPTGQTGYFPGMRPAEAHVLEDAKQETFQPGQVATPEVQTTTPTPVDPNQTEFNVAAIPTIKAAPLEAAASRFANSDQKAAALADARQKAATMRSAPVGQTVYMPGMAPDAAGKRFDARTDAQAVAPVAETAAPVVPQAKGQLTFNNALNAKPDVSALPTEAPPMVNAAGVRDASVSNGTGVETQHETQMMEQWRQQNAADVSAKAPVATHFDDGNSIVRPEYSDNAAPALLNNTKNGTPVIAILRDENGKEFSAPVVYNHGEVRAIPEGVTISDTPVLTANEAVEKVQASYPDGEAPSASKIKKILDGRGSSAEVTSPKKIAEANAIRAKAWEAGFRGASQDKLSSVIADSGMKLVGYAETKEQVKQGGIRPMPESVTSVAPDQKVAVGEAPVATSFEDAVAKPNAEKFLASMGIDKGSLKSVFDTNNSSRGKLLDSLTEHIASQGDPVKLKSLQELRGQDEEAWQKLRMATKESINKIVKDPRSAVQAEPTKRDAALISEKETADVERVQPKVNVVSDSQVQKDFDRTLSIAQKKGLDVSLRQATDAIKAGGQYDPSKRAVQLTMNNLVAPSRQDVISLLHEIAHDQIKDVPDVVKGALDQWINGLDLNQFKGNPEVDPRLSGEKSALSGATLTDEKLVELMAQNGVDRKVAEGIIPTLWRAVKEHVLNAAIYLQKAILGDVISGTKFAEMYADNLVNQVRGGDAVTMDSFLSMFGRHPTLGEVSVKETGLHPRTGDYPLVKGLSADAAEYNVRSAFAEVKERLAASGITAVHDTDAMLSDSGYTVQREQPVDPKKQMSESLATKIPRMNIQIAAANELTNLYKSIHSEYVSSLPVYSPAELEIARSAGRPIPEAPTFEEFLSERRIQNPELISQKVVDELAAQLEMEGFKKEDLVDPTVSIDKLPELDRDAAVEHMKVQLERDITKTTKNKTDSADTVDSLSKKEELRKAQIVSVNKNLADTKELLSVMEQGIREEILGLKKSIPKMNDASSAYGETLATLAGLQDKEEIVNKYTDKLIDSINVNDLPIGGILRAINDLQSRGEFNLKSDTPSKIRSVIAAEAELDHESPLKRLVGEQNLKSNALLAAVIAYSKQQEHLTALLDHQMSRKTEDFKAINSLREVLRETSDKKLTGIYDGLKLKKALTPSETLIYKWLDARKKALAQQVELFSAQRRVTSGDVLLQKMHDLNGRLEQRVRGSYDLALLPGFPIPNPKSADIKGEDLFKPENTIKLDEGFTPANSREVMTNLKTWLDARADDVTKHDIHYNSVKDFFDKASKSLYLQDNKYVTQGKFASGHFENHAREALMSGTRAGELANQSIHRFAENQNRSRVLAFEEGFKVQKLGGKFFKAVKLSGEEADRRFLAWGINGFDQRSADVTTRKEVFDKLRREVMQSKDPIFGALKDEKTWKLYTDWITANLDSYRNIDKFSFDKLGNKIHDDKFMVKNPQTGKMEKMLRAPIDRGVQTIPRFINSDSLDAVRRVSNELRGIQTAGGIEGIVGPHTADGINRLREALKPLHADDTVVSDLLTPLLRDNANIDLPAPARADGVKRTISSDMVRDVFNKADILDTFGKLYDRLSDQEKSTQTREEYQATAAKWAVDKLTRLLDIASPPTDMDRLNLSINSLPKIALDSRETADFPQDWVTHAAINPESVMRMTHTLSANAAFGENYRELKTQILGMYDQVKLQRDKWAQMDPQERAALKKSDKLQYENLSQSEAKLSKLGKNGERYFGTLDAIFSPDHSGLNDLGTMHDLFTGSVTMMLTGIGSAVRNLVSPLNKFIEAKSISPEVWYDIGSAYGGLAKDFLASAWNIFGLIAPWTPDERYYKLLTDSLGGDAGMTKSLSEILAGHRGPDYALDKQESRGTAAMRRTLSRMRAVMIHGKLSVRDNVQGPVFNLNPFQWTQVRMNMREFFVELRRFESTSAKIADFYRQNPDRVGSPVTGKEIGISGDFYSNKYARWTEFGIRPEDLAQKMLKSKGTEAIDPQTVAKMWTYVSNGITGEANILNRPAFTQTSKLGKMSTTLLGFPIFQATRFFDLFRNKEGRQTLGAFAKGLTVFGLGMLPASVLFGKLLDEYNDEIYGKHQAVRPLNGDVGNDLLSLADRMVQAGTLGLFGDIIPTALNVAGSPGGRNQLTLDGRIVWVNDLLSLAKLTKNYIAMGGAENVNYANFFKPLMNVAGGMGVMQNLQVMNNLASKFGIHMDNTPVVGGLIKSEEEMINRSNTYAWIRGAAYASGLEVKGTGTGDYTPNQATPWITNMVLAAYANDRQEFQKAYVGAIKAAQSIGGTTDALDYVKRAYAARNPLVAVLQDRPSVGEFSQLLQSMPPEGRTAVQSAVNLYNMYGTGLGLQPFVGVSESDPKRTARLSAQRIQDARTRANSWF